MSDIVCITGASSGIGYAMAMEFAKHGYYLVLSGRDRAALADLEKKIRERYQVKVWIIVEDLAEKNGARSLYRQMKEKKIEIDVLVNNAGLGYGGLFLEQPLEKDEDIVMVNMYSVTALTKLFGEDMKKRRKGKILQVASTGAFHPGPYTAVYYAAKAYVLSFSRAVRRELRQYNIQVSVLCPGAVATNFSKRAGKMENPIAMRPEYVAKEAYRGLKKGKELIIPKWYYRLLIKVPPFLAARMIEKQQKNMI